LNGSHTARNWIGIVGAYTADAVLQFFGVGAFLLVIFPAALGVRWFRSMKVQSPLAKSLGGIWLMMFVPAMLALLPGQLRWAHVIPMEGLLGRVIGDFLIHYLNLVGAYIVCATVLATALYLSTAFSFSAVQVWAPTRFAFVTALWNRNKDWRQERARKRQQKELEQRRISKPAVKTQLIQTRPASPSAQATPEPRRTGIERMLAEEEAAKTPAKSTTGGIQPGSLLPTPTAQPAADPEVTERGDSGQKAKTTMPPADLSCLPAACCSGPTSSRPSMPTNSSCWHKFSPRSTPSSTFTDR
jgi:S-DNA-T family DNA segregation ATPase FtsK/SpoIIIE